MKLRIILFIAFVCINFGCNKKDDVIKIYPLKPNNEAFSARIVKSIPLSNVVDAIIGNADKLLIDKQHIYVMDRDQARGLLIFSENGTFIKKILMGNPS